MKQSCSQSTQHAARGQRTARISKTNGKPPTEVQRPRVVQRDLVVGAAKHDGIVRHDAGGVAASRRRLVRHCDGRTDSGAATSQESGGEERVCGERNPPTPH